MMRCLALQLSCTHLSVVYFKVRCQPIIRNIEKMANEKNWPKAISNLDGRFQLRDQLKHYKVFKIAQIGAC